MTGEVEIERRSSGHRRVIQVHCATHGGPIGYTNLVARKVDATIELDPHATGACVILIDESGATVLRDALTEWLG